MYDINALLGILWWKCIKIRKEEMVGCQELIKTWLIE